MKAIEINNLCFSYVKDSDQLTLDNVSLDVNQGEYVTIIGHNGSGKSTLAKLIIGLLTMKSGQIKVFDQELNDENVRSIRNRIGIVFQNPDNQFIGATVRDDIAFGLENHLIKTEDMDQIIDEFARKVNMLEFLDKEPSALSGGQKQRVAIAGVLAMNPDIIIMDEATAMLDPRGKAEIINLTHQLKRDNTSLTIISITHDIEEAYLSDRVIVLNHGKVLFNDVPALVFGHEQELKEIGLDIPFAQKLMMELNENGIDMRDCHSLEDVKHKLCQ